MANVYTDIDAVYLSTAFRELMRTPEEDRDHITNPDPMDWFPLAEGFILGTEWKITDRGSLRTWTEAMPYRAPDSAMVLGGRDGWQTKSGQMPMMAKGFQVREIDMIKRAAASRDDAEKRLMLDDVFNDLRNGYEAWRATMRIACASLMRTAAMTISGNGMQPSAINFVRSGSNSSTVAVPWSTTATADPFGEEEAVLDVLDDEQNLGPEDMVVLATRAAYREYTATDAVRNAHPSFRVLDEIPRGDINSMRAVHELPPIVIVRAQARDYGQSSASPLFNAGEWLYVPRRPLGTIQVGTPPSADLPDIDVAQLAGPGPVAWLEWETNAPTMRTMVDAAAAPVLYDPNATYQLTI